MRCFCWIHAKPACSMAPVVVTPDELGDAWRSFRFDLQLKVWRNDESFGSVDGIEMAFGFDELIAHGAYSRELPAGTNIGSGTVSNRSEEHTSELQSLMRISYAVFCFKKNN